MAQVLDAARAIFADSVGAIDAEDVEKGLFDEGPARGKFAAAVQEALGATVDANGDYVVGGVQPIRGQPLMLPRGVNANLAEAALDRVGLQLAGISPLSEMPAGLGSARGIGGSWPTGGGGALELESGAPLPETDIYAGLKAASLNTGKFPQLGSDPAGAWANLRLERIPGRTGQDAYVLVGERNGMPFYVEDQDGKTYAFSLQRLIESVPR
jgi:hypothetical protein